MEELIKVGSLGRAERIDLQMKKMAIAADQRDRNGLNTAFARAMSESGGAGEFDRVIRYNYGQALYETQQYAEAGATAAGLARDYYDHLGVSPGEMFGKNPSQIEAIVRARSEWAADLKKLADCLHLVGMVKYRLGRRSGLEELSALKLYVTAGAWRSAVAAGQEAVDNLVEAGLYVDARNIIARHLLPIIQLHELTGYWVPLRSQYAVVLAYCGEDAAARREMAQLEAYKASGNAAEELKNQRLLIERIIAERTD